MCHFLSDGDLVLLPFQMFIASGNPTIKYLSFDLRGSWLFSQLCLGGWSGI